METYLVWLAAGFVLVIAELVTGTFFLLILGIAAFAGSATAWFGFGFWLEAMCAAAVAVSGARRSAPRSRLVSFSEWRRQRYLRTARAWSRKGWYWRSSSSKVMAGSLQF